MCFLPAELIFSREREKDGRTKKKTEPVKRAAKSVEKPPARVVDKILKRVEEKLSGKDMKATLGDYIRLVQLRKELDEEETREIRVRWIEPEEKRSETEE